MSGSFHGRNDMIRLCLSDPGVKQELASWRWKLIYVLLVVYFFGFVVYSIKENAEWMIQSLQVPANGLRSGSLFFVGSDSQSHKQQQQLLLHGSSASSLALTHVNRRRTPVSLTNADIVKEYEGLNDARECGRKNSRYALGQLLELREEIQKEAHDPIILGGVGDSATRAIAYLTTQLGVFQDKYGLHVRKDSRDSKVFTNGFNTFACDENNATIDRVIKSFVFYSRSMEDCRSANYDKSCVNSETWNEGVQWTSTMMRILLNHTKTYTARKSTRSKFPFGLWGFKHPRSAFVLPYFYYVLGGKMKYIHIVRDGRDIAAGDNQGFLNVCRKYHPVDSPKCEDSYGNRVELWAQLNLDILDWMRENLDPDQYLIVRIEDLVKGDRECFDRIATFVKTSTERANDIINKSIRLFTVHSDRYYGQKYTSSEQRAYTKAVKAHPISMKAFHALGYDVENWGTANSCVNVR